MHASECLFVKGSKLGHFDVRCFWSQANVNYMSYCSIVPVKLISWCF